MAVRRSGLKEKKTEIHRENNSISVVVSSCAPADKPGVEVPGGNITPSAPSSEQPPGTAPASRIQADLSSHVGRAQPDQPQTFLLGALRWARAALTACQSCVLGPAPYTRGQFPGVNRGGL